MSFGLGAASKKKLLRAEKEIDGWDIYRLLNVLETCAAEARETGTTPLLRWMSLTAPKQINRILEHIHSLEHSAGNTKHLHPGGL